MVRRNNSCVKMMFLFSCRVVADYYYFPPTAERTLLQFRLDESYIVYVNFEV